MLKHQPHRRDVILRVAPIASRGNIPEDQFVFEAAADPRCGPGDFSGDEVLPAARRFVIVENAIADEEAVGLPVNPRQLGRKCLRATVGAGRPERRLFRLWRFDSPEPKISELDA